MRGIMAKKHPCLICEIHLKGISKDNPRCRACTAREEYNQAIEQQDVIPVSVISSKPVKTQKPKEMKKVTKELSKEANKAVGVLGTYGILGKDIHEGLKKMAQAEMRPVEYQAAWILKQAVEKFMEGQNTKA